MQKYFYHIGNLRIYTEREMHRSPRLTTEFGYLGVFKNRSAAFAHSCRLDLYLKRPA